MSSYLDYSIEQKVNGKWKQTSKSDYDACIPNPYILKQALYDTDRYSACDNDLTKDTKAIFARKYQKVRKNSVYYKYEKDLEKKEDYPYNTGCKFKINNVDPYPDRNEMILKLKELNDNLDTKFNDTLIEIDINKFNEHLEENLQYLSYPPNIEDEIIENGDIRNYMDQIPRLIKSFEHYYTLFDTVYEATIFLKYKFVYDFIINCFGQHEYEKPQYTILGDVKMSTYYDVENIIKDLTKCIDNIHKQMDIENLLKNRIAGYLETYHKDKNTELYLALKDYVKDRISDDYSDDELEELEQQKFELKMLLRYISENGRLIWQIS